MTKEVQDGGTPVEGQAGQPSQPGSDGQGAGDSSGQVTLTREQWDTLITRLDKVERGGQSEKDKAVRKTNERIDQLEGDIRSLLKQAKREGKSLDDVMTELDRQDEADLTSGMRELVTAFRDGKFPVLAGGNRQSEGVDAAKVFAEKGLDPKDPDVQLALSELRGKPASEIELAAYRLRDRKTTSPSPTGAQAAALSGRQPQKVDTAALQAEYDEKATKLRGHPAAIANLKAEYRKKGLSDLW